MTTEEDFDARLRRAGLEIRARALAEDQTVYQVRGDTFPLRGRLRELGGRWEAGEGAWIFEGEDPSAALAEAVSGRVEEGGRERPHYHGHRERLRARFLEAPDALPDYELLELLLFFSIPRRDVKPLAKTLLAEFGSLAGVLAAEPGRLQAVEGVIRPVIVELKAMRELSRRLARLDLTERPRLKSAKEVLDYCRVAQAHEQVERLRLLFLDAKLRLIADEVQQSGTVDHTPAYPREIVKRALELGASGLILVHNHPAADAEPSAADITMTEAVARALETVDIRLHDHFVIARNGHASLRSLGLL